MKKKGHPKYETITVRCACGESFETKSTLCRDLLVEVCSKCHPFYTGKQGKISSEGRVGKFKAKYGKK